MNKARTVLTASQKKFIADNFNTMTDKEMGEHLGLKYHWINQYRSRNGFSKKPHKAKVVEMNNGYFNVNQRECWL